MSRSVTNPAPLHTQINPSHPVDLCTVLDCCADEEQENWLCLKNLLEQASSLHAQEIHLEPDQDCWRLRIRSPFSFTETRLDAVENYQSCLKQLQRQLWAQQSEQQPYKGWFGFRVSATDRLVQLDVLPGARGISYVLTLLHPMKAPPPRLDELGMNREQQTRTRGFLKQGKGLVLLASDITHARSQTARALVQELVAPDRKIVCADSPGHPLIPRTTQIALDTPARKNQVRALTAMCHLNCDAIIACQTLDDNLGRQLVKLASERTLIVQSVDVISAADAVDRMLTMGVRSEALARTLSAVIVQRQVQCVCPYCRHTQVPDDAGTAWLAEHSPIKAGNINDWLRHRMRSSFSCAPGCERCNHTGRAKPLNIFDIVAIDDAVKDALYDADIRYALSLLREQTALSSHLLKLAQDGIITLSEAVRVAPLEASNH